MPERLGADMSTPMTSAGRGDAASGHLGSFERFIGILIENYAGALPAWFAPEHAVCSISERTADYAAEVAAKLKERGFRSRPICALKRSTVKFVSIVAKCRTFWSWVKKNAKVAKWRYVNVAAATRPSSELKILPHCCKIELMPAHRAPSRSRVSGRQIDQQLRSL